MQHHALVDMAKRAVRATICPVCYQRPVGSESLQSDVPRACEPHCTLFIHLPKLTEIVVKRQARTSDPDDTVVTLICPQCHESLTAGEFCSEHLARTCPLSRYSGVVLQILERMRDHHVGDVAVAATPAPR